MTTPLKALIQERLRAKIVRQGDDEGGDGYTGGFPASLASATPLIDASEYMVPPPLTDKASELRGSRNYSNNRDDESYLQEDDVNHYGAETKYDHRDRGPSSHLESSDYRLYEEYSTRPSCKVVAARQASPIKTKHGKRSWRAGHENRPLTRDRKHTNQAEEPSVHSAKRARVVEKPRLRYHSEDGYTGLSPTRRKNYDLSGAYQRYREISSKREQSREPESPTHRHESSPPSWSVPPRREYTHTRHYYDDEYDLPEYSNDRASRWASPERTTTTSKRCIQESYDPKEDSMPPAPRQHRRLGDVHPVNHVAPTHPIVVSPGSLSTKRRSFSPVPSRTYSNQFEYPGNLDTSSDRLVFPAALYVPTVPRSPSAHFLRPDSSEDSTPECIGRSGSYDIVLSPGSCQAAKDFVEKRQKRSSQGTPRTMATHRWLQSMMDARRTVSSTSVSKSEENTYDGCYPEASEFPSNTGHVYGETKRSSAAIDDDLASLPYNEPRASLLEQSPAFYSPRMYSSGSFFEADI